MSEISIIPQPVQLTRKDGFFRLIPGTTLLAESPAAAVAEQFSNAVRRSTGYSFEISSSQSGDRFPRITFRLSGELETLGAEGYQLSVSPQEVVLDAFQPVGLFYALQTLLQLLPPDVYSPTRVEKDEWLIPCVEIEDTPRFAWRGAMLDVARHFMPLEFVLKFIDLLAMHKLNVFHWHLTEDQGWRIEIKKYPRLTEIGSWRKETLVGHYWENRENPRYDGVRHGGFYTQEEVRRVVAYAAERHVRVMPEIEMPGHSQAAITAYPELGNTGESMQVSTTWGIHANIYNVEESTIHFLQDVLEEVLALFPSEFIHIGGDEVPKIQWKQSPAAQTRMKALGLKDEDELQSYFIRRMDEFLVSHGRRLVGWDEILEGGLAPNATVMSWRGEEGGIEAANAGHDVVMAPNDYLYLDYYQSEDHNGEPLAIGSYLPLEKVYQYNPIPSGIDTEHARHILGAQAQLWTEYVPNPARAEYMLFPRLCALSELVWTPFDGKNYAAFLNRLQIHLQRLSVLGVNFRPLD